MSSKNNRNIILGVGIIISFALLTLSISTYYNYQHDVRQDSRLNPDAIDDMTIEEIKQLMIENRSA